MQFLSLDYPWRPDSETSAPSGFLPLLSRKTQNRSHLAWPEAVQLRKLQHPCTLRLTYLSGTRLSRWNSAILPSTRAQIRLQAANSL